MPLKKQFDRLIAQLRELGDWSKNTIARQVLLRRLKQEKLSDELFRECIEKGDQVVQALLLTLASTSQLLVLGAEGCTKRIRNNATQALNKK